MHLRFRIQFLGAAPQMTLIIDISGQEWVKVDLIPLTFRVSLEGIVCYSHNFKDNLGIKHKFLKYLKESCCMASYEQFSSKRSQENAFIGEIFPKSSGLFWPL